MQACRKKTPLTGLKRFFSADNVTQDVLLCSLKKNPKHFQRQQHLQKFQDNTDWTIHSLLKHGLGSPGFLNKTLLKMSGGGGVCP